MTCTKCDRRRREQGLTQLVGRPCDICDGTKYDYIGRTCRHCNPANVYYREE